MKKILLFILGLSLFFSFIQAPLANAVQCLSQFPDTYWSKGNPWNPDFQLNPYLVLNSAIVELDTPADLTNVTSVVKAEYPDVFYGKNTKVLAGNVWSGSSTEMEAMVNRIGRSATNVQNIDAFLTRFSILPTNGTQIIPFALFDMSKNAKPRTLPIKVTYQYAGQDCQSRNIVIPSTVEILPVQFRNLNEIGYMDGAFQVDHKNIFGLINRDFQSLNEIRDAFKTTLAYLNQSEQNPINIRWNKGNANLGVIPGNAWTKTGTWYSYDGCLLDSTGNNPVNATNFGVRTKVDKSKCKVQFTWRNIRNPSIWFYADAYITIESTVSSSKTTIVCSKGKITKKISAINPKCPSGYKKK